MYVGDIPYNLDAYHREVHQPDQTVILKLGMHVTEMIDLTNFFEKLFQLPNFLDEIIEWNNSLNDPDWISNILQTKAFHACRQHHHLKIITHSLRW